MLWGPSLCIRDLTAYLIGENQIERQQKGHESHKHAPRGLTQPLQEAWLGVRRNFDMFSPGTCGGILREKHFKIE